MVPEERRGCLTQLFDCLGLRKKKTENDVELNTLRGNDIPIIPPTRNETIVPESSAGTKTRKLSIALPSKKTKEERATDLVNAWFENINNAAQSSGNSGEPSTKEPSTEDVSNQPEEASAKDTNTQPEEALTKDAKDHLEEAPAKDASDHTAI
ncbi:unnamed protein product [Fusarium equiseti]|uniref:Uncharacterized protein n=1 Tax=Fusarium equiseti TaxID=61235 RepID=A0A8J2NA37_FUSEQ|nr:unnamed protein product [Fusarium equiseti]